MAAVSARNTARRFRPCCQQKVASRAVVITPTDKLITLSMLSKGTFRPAGLASHTPSPADATHTVAIPADVLVIGTKLSIPFTRALLRNHTAAIYKMVERGQLPAAVVIKLGRKVYFHRASLLDWLDQNRASSLTGGQ